MAVTPWCRLRPDGWRAVPGRRVFSRAPLAHRRLEVSHLPPSQIGHPLGHAIRDHQIPMGTN